MTKLRTEEQFPLLLVLVGDRDVSQNNKRFFGKGRFDGITSGASTIITEWPNYLSSCWLTTLICGFTLFIASIMLSSCLKYQHQTRFPRCVSDYQVIDNKTIHLVHTSSKWKPHQLDLVENIARTFPNYQIHIIILINNQTKLINDTKRDINKTTFNDTQVVKGNKTVKTLQDVIKKHPSLLVTNISYNDIFEKSPLNYNWMLLNNQMKTFAVRVLQLWEFGGLTYDLLEYKLPPPKKFRNCTSYIEMKLKNYIRRGYKRYEKLEQEMVSVDSNGLHIETKIPCHAFLGKVLMKLKKATHNTTPRAVLNGPMFTFCKSGAIDKEFCHVKNIFFK